MEPRAIVDRMMEKDYFSQWLGIRIISLEEGNCQLSMTLRKEMLNGFGIAHGGITYSLADSALAFASNSKGIQSLSIETSISHVISLKEGDELFARAQCVTETTKLGHYDVTLWSASPTKPVAIFRGIVYKTATPWADSPGR